MNIATATQKIILFENGQLYPSLVKTLGWLFMIVVAAVVGATGISLTVRLVYNELVT